jgi:ketosteroid isomerase-like protein
MGAGAGPTPYIGTRDGRDGMYRELTRGHRGRIVTGRGDHAMRTTERLERFFEQGWNHHDVDVLMTFMTDDCVWESAAGPAVWGTRHTGREQVRAAFASLFAAFPDVAFRDVRHLVAGDRGLSEWTFTGTAADGATVEVGGCDVFTFRDGRIALKQSFLKRRTT